MKLNRGVLAVLLASASVAVAAPALAQDKPAAAAPERKFNISSQARKEIVALQEAVNANNTAAIPAAIAAAKAKAKTNDDKYVVGQLELKAAVASKNDAAVAAAIESVLASGVVDSAQSIDLYNNLGSLRSNAKQYDQAAAAYENALKLDANNVNAMIMLGEVRNSQGRPADAVALFQKAIGARVAAGQKPEELWYKRAVALAYKAKSPAAVTLSRDWVKAYPTPKNWRDTIVIYQTNSQLEDSALIDSMRLAHAAGALSGENDYYRFANALMLKGYPGEAKAVLEQGFAAKAIDKSKATFSQMYASATTKSQGDRASLAASASTAKAGGDAKKVMVIADAYYGYGDYAQAADLYRAALGKAGADKDLVNLRLGMALARSGDKAGATAALNAAGGAQAEVAKLWLTYLSTKA
ncbi:tetratricopeptide repeat protein [Sphingomonas edaphi]|uniref:Tetratricopeptide repeat protein n=1 Tax=Sphingomonas edaphi TaxID=2315689 RepID=A0A418Q0V8_9SPHN|nr:tetratricopeptide repeat protein [Sphingomonas edaphi]RIX31585.1 hypothetical protein D3M59_00750 [Sphingomonas edaphi]